MVFVGYVGVIFLCYGNTKTSEKSKMWELELLRIALTKRMVYATGTMNHLSNRGFIGPGDGLGGLEASNQGRAIIFYDAASVVEAKEELEEIVASFKEKYKNIRLCARTLCGVFWGVFLVTSKTQLARASVGVADIQLISGPANKFVELYVGMGAPRVTNFLVRDEEAPSINPIDTIDYVTETNDVYYPLCH